MDYETIISKSTVNIRPTMTLTEESPKLENTHKRETEPLLPLTMPQRGRGVTDSPARKSKKETWNRCFYVVVSGERGKDRVFPIFSLSSAGGNESIEEEKLRNFNDILIIISISTKRSKHNKNNK
jgi:hypothetical protein